MVSGTLQVLPPSWDSLQRVSLSFLLRERNADDFGVVANEGAFSGVGGVSPDDVALPEIEAVGFDDVGAINFLVTFHRKLRDHEVALLGEQKVAVFMRSDKDGAPAHRFLKGDGLKGFPHPLPGKSLHAAELPVTAGGEEMTITQHRGVHDAVKVGRFRLAGALRAIDDFRGGFILRTH